VLGVWEGLEDSDLGLINDLNSLSLLWESWLSLGDELDTLLLGLLLGGIVGLNSLDESLVASALANVFNSNVDSLAELLTTNNLGDLNTNSNLSDIEDDTSSTMVELVWHTLVDGWVSNDINVVTLLENGQISGKVWHSLGSERLRELVSSLRSETVVMWH